MKDILFYALDNVTELDYDSYETYISIEPEYPLPRQRVIIKNDLKDNIEIIIKEVNRLVKNEIDRLVKEIENKQSLNKKDKYLRYKQNKLIKVNFYDGLKIKPEILLNFSFKKNDGFNYDQEHREWFFKMSNSLQNSIKNEESIERYLDSIGYKDLNFRISYSLDKYYVDKASIYITFDI